MNEQTQDLEKLLSDRRVVDEIQRHLWIESERAGYDIGFEKAKEDWVKNFSKAWMEYHMPEEFLKARKAAMQTAVSASASTASQAKSSIAGKSTIKRRRAKSYLM